VAVQLRLVNNVWKGAMIMKKHLAIVAAAALAVGTYSFAQDAATPAPADDRNALQRAGDKIGEGVEKTKDAITGDRTAAQSPNAEEIHDVLAQVAQAAFTKEGLDDMAERFVDADRNRLGQNKDALKNTTEIDGRVAQLQEDWKGKYGQDFNIKDEDKIYNAFATVTEGEETGARTASGVKIEGDVSADRNRADVKVENNTGVDAPKANTTGDTPADRNLNDPGRNVATVHIMESHGLPALDIPMIHEAGGWKIDIPDSVDSNKLAANVKSALTSCGEHKDKWPATADEGYRAVTHKVLAAVFDKLPAEGAARDAAGDPAAAPATPAPQPQ